MSYEILFKQIHEGKDLSEIQATYEKHPRRLKYYHKNWLFNEACAKGRLDVLKFLESVGANPLNDFYEGFKRAANQGHLPVVRYLLVKGADPTSDSFFALRAANEWGHKEVVSLLKLFLKTDKLSKMVVEEIKNNQGGPQ
jgi:hypothetical protein